MRPAPQHLGTPPITYIVVRAVAWSVIDALVASKTFTGYYARAIQLPAPAAAVTAVVGAVGSGAIRASEEAIAVPARSTTI